MTRLRGRAPIGERLIEKVPHGHWKTTTLIAALDHAGVRCSMVVDGAVNAAVFESFIQLVLAPTLNKGDLVIMDNLSSHKGTRISDLVGACGASVLYLPPYSPDLNPIEMAYSKIKQRLRSLACRDQPTLWGAMQGVLDRVSSRDAENFFRHCGYSLQVE